MSKSSKLRPKAMRPSAELLLPRPAFPAEIVSWLRAEGHRPRFGVSPTTQRPLLLVRSCSSLLVLHLLHTPSSADEVLSPGLTGAMTDAFAAHPRSSAGRSRRLVHLWQDQWEEHGAVVRSRLLAALGRSVKIGARSTEVRRIDAVTLASFLVAHHLWSATAARYRYGLFSAAGELVAVASFSARWNRRRGGERRASHELIRYCSRRGETVVGGISKLLKAFQRDTHADECVTMIDRDWSSSGEGWAALGFRRLTREEPVAFWLGPDGRRAHSGSDNPNPHRRRLPASVQAELGELRARRLALRGAPAAEAEDVAAEDVAARERDRAEEECFLATQRFFAVHDAGAERWLLDLTPRSPARSVSPAGLVKD